MEGLSYSSSEAAIREMVATLGSGEINEKHFLRACLGKVCWREK